MTERSKGSLDLEALLTIDVGSELRKLANAQLQGSWQLPAELVRHALRRGARRIDIEFERGGLRLRTDAVLLDPDLMQDLVELADADAPPARRHRALTGLERAGGAALISLVGLTPNRLHCTVRGQDTHGRQLQHEVSIGHGRRGKVAKSGELPNGTVVRVTGLKIDRSRAREWLSDVARFANATIQLDGRELPRGFQDAISRATLSTDPRVDVAIPVDGDAARVWLLTHGVVVTHASVSPAPCFEAAIEMSSIVDPMATPADIRAAFDDTVPELVRAVVGHLCELATQIERLPPSLRPRVAGLMLEAARMRRYPGVTEVPLFEGRDANGEDRWFSLDEISQRLDVGARTLAVLSAKQDPDDFVIDDIVLFLEESERASLARLMDVSFQPPRHRDELRRSGLRGTVRLRELRRRIGDGLSAIFVRAKAVSDDELEPGEMQFLNALRAVIGRPGDVIQDVEFVAGDGQIRRAGKRLLLPRAGDQVRRAIERFEHDPAHVYPCALAWLAGIQAPRASARSAWAHQHDPLRSRA